MTFDEILDIVAASTSHDWHTEACWGARSGPSYHNQFNSMESGSQSWLEVKTHSKVAIYKPDIDISLAWGLHQNEDYKEPWTSSFSDAHASSSYLDIFYKGSLVFRCNYVDVDGGRACLPVPKFDWNKQTEKMEDLRVPRRRYELTRLLHSFDSTADFEEYFDRAKFRVIDEPWP